MLFETTWENSKCRECFICFINLIYKFLASGLGATLTLFALPALVSGCSSAPSADEGRTASVGIAVRSMSGKPNENKSSVLDIFVFNDDKLKRLDSYQRFENWNTDMVEIASCTGDKIVYGISNCGHDRFGWIQINSLNAMEKIMTRLEDENPEYPVMSGVMKIRAEGDSYGGVLDMKPLASKIILRSIRCDFNGRPYQGECITKAKAYLLNVNAECPVTASGRVHPSRIINSGRLDENDMSQFKDRSMLEYRFKDNIGKEWQDINAEFLCYPNSAMEESPGTPFTKLVIEGVVEGHTYYWPIAINREEEGGEEEGVFRNSCYIYDIDIRRKGCTDPDAATSAEDIMIIMEVERWEEKDNYQVLF